MIDAKPPGTAWNPLAALLAPATWVRGLMRRRRERKAYEAWRIILTRQGNMRGLYLGGKSGSSE